MKREITLMMYTNGRNDPIVEELKGFCRAENIIFKANNYRGPEIYDFIIEGNTEDYKKVFNRFGDVIKETYYAELGNVFDFNREEFERWKGLMEAYHKESLNRSSLLREFCDLIIDEQDVEKLEHLMKYPIEEAAKVILRDKIAMLKGDKSEWERYMLDCLEINKMVDLLQQVKEKRYELNEKDIDLLVNILKKSI